MPTVIDQGQGYGLAQIFNSAYQTGQQSKARREEKERLARMDKLAGERQTRQDAFETRRLDIMEADKDRAAATQEAEAGRAAAAGSDKLRLKQANLQNMLAKAPPGSQGARQIEEELFRMHKQNPGLERV